MPANTETFTLLHILNKLTKVSKTYPRNPLVDTKFPCKGRTIRYDDNIYRFKVCNHHHTHTNDLLQASLILYPVIKSNSWRPIVSFSADQNSPSFCPQISQTFRQTLSQKLVMGKVTFIQSMNCQHLQFQVYL